MFLGVVGLGFRVLFFKSFMLPTFNLKKKKKGRKERRKEKERKREKKRIFVS